MVQISVGIMKLAVIMYDLMVKVMLQLEVMCQVARVNMQE